MAFYDDFATKDWAWLLLRTLVHSPRLAKHASDLKAWHFVEVGFDWRVDDLLKGLLVEGRRNIARLRRDLPDYFDVLDHGQFVTSYDALRGLAKAFVEETHYLDDARSLKLSDLVPIALRNRRHELEDRLRWDLGRLAKLLLPDGSMWERPGCGVTYRDWQAQHPTLGRIDIRITGGKKKWHCSPGGDVYIFSSSWALLVQSVLGYDLPRALDWIEDFLEGQPIELPPPPPPRIVPQPVGYDNVVAPRPAVEAPVVQLIAAAAAVVDQPRPFDEKPPRPLDVALGYAQERGWPVFPCNPKTKAPLTRPDLDPATGEEIKGTGGHKKATRDEAQIGAWWAERPSSMIGIPTGEAIGAWVLEIDIEDKKTGITFTTVDAQISAVEAELGVKLPPTMRVNTPRGGVHLFFKSANGYPRSDCHIRRGGKELRGIDLRGAGGYVIGAGSVRHDGSPYVLVENREIAMAPVELVDWACARGRWAPEESPPPVPIVNEHEDTSAAVPSTSTRRTKVPLERGQRWAAAALTGNTRELAAARPGCRNNLTNILAYRMGRMVRAAWVTEQAIIDAFLAASKTNGKIADDGGMAAILATIASGIAAGKRKPLCEIPDRPWQPWRPVDDDDDNVWLRCLRSEMRALYRLRFPGNPGAVDAADERLNEIIQFTGDPWVIGRELELTFIEYQRLAKERHGRRRGARLPSTMKPADVPQETVEAFLKERKRTQDKDYQTKRRAQEKAERDAVNDLDDQPSAILTFLRQNPGKHSIDNIYRGVKRSRAFESMKPASAKNAIRRLLVPPSGKPSFLSQMVSVSTTQAKNRGSKTMVEAKSNEG